MAEAAFDVTYDGPALADGRMPVGELAPALLALGDLFSEASRIAYPDQTPVALNVKATADGSFIVQLILETAGWDQIVDFFTSDPVEALINIREFIIGGAGLLWYIKHRRGRKVAEREPVEPGKVRITFADGSSLEVPAEVDRMYESIEVRKKASRVVEPVRREGVDYVEFRAESTVTVRVDKQEVEAYEPPTLDEEQLLDVEQEMLVHVVAAVFVEGNKWRFSDGAEAFSATVEDQEFQARVEGGEAFRKGDMLLCRFRLVQSRRPDGKLHTERYLVRVLRHIERPDQLPLGSDEPEQLGQ